MIWAIGYALGFIVATGLLYRRMLWKERDSFQLGTSDYAIFLLGSASIGAVWPLAVAVAPVIAWARRDLEKNHPKEVADRQWKREAEILEREREIERIEAELGIRGMRR